MLLDSFQLNRLIVQIRYDEAVELWDRAGKISRRLKNIWPDLKTGDVGPSQQILQSQNVQLETGLLQSTATCFNLKTVESLGAQLSATYDAWRSDLELNVLNRVSSRAIFYKSYPTIGEANKAIFSFRLARWPEPEVRVFDQPSESPLNSVEIVYKFEDEASFAFLRVRTEYKKIEFKPPRELKSLSATTEEEFHLVIDFDRGLKKESSANDFRMEEWLKGFNHLLRRDLEKVTGRL